MFSSMDPRDPKSVKYQFGLVILLGSTPIAWASKLLTEIALSTMESEYIALTQSIRIFLMLCQVLNEVSDALHLRQN